MRPLREYLVFGLLSSGRARCWNHANTEALDASLAATGVTLVAFVAVGQPFPVPNEPKSQAIEREWLSAATESPNTFLSVDCEAEPHTCAKYDISSYPTLYLFENETPVTKYQGPYRASAFSNFVSRLKRLAITELNAEALDSFRSADEIVFIGYLAPNDNVARQTFAATAEKYRDEFTFGLVTDEALIADQNQESPATVCHVIEDGETRTFKSFSEPDGLDKFVVEASRPVIPELTPYNQQRLLNRGWPMVYVFGKTADDRAELRKSLQKFAKSYYDSLTCVMVDPLEFPGLQAKLGLEPGVYPSGAVHQLSKDRIYPYPRGQAFDSKALQKWGLDVWQGKVKPWAPPGANLGPTKAATRKVSIANIPGVNIRVGGRDEL